MWKKIAIGGAVAAGILGIGTAAMAASGSTTSGTPAPSSTGNSSTPAAHGKHHGRDGMRVAVHAQWVTRDAKTNAFVTHDEIRGQVTAVSPTSITVKAADNTSETYAVTSTTKVRERADKKGTASTIGAVHSGDNVMVVGTGTSTYTATSIVDVKK